MQQILDLINTNWGASITTTMVFSIIFSAIIFIGRKAIIAKINASVKFEYDKKLAEINSDLRKQEQQFKSDIDHNKSSIKNIQLMAIKGAALRRGDIHKRQIVAIEQLWATISVYQNREKQVEMVERIKLDGINTEKQKYDLKKFASSMHDFSDDQKEELKLIDKHRPFIPDKLWMCFAAYRQIIQFNSGKIFLLKSELLDLLNEDFNKETKQKIVDALPESGKMLEQYGSKSFPAMIEILKDQMLDEAKKALFGTDKDQEDISRATYIHDKVQEVMHKKIDPTSDFNLPIDIT
jgi:hypothetical protein